jgi:hypothetical protein
MTYALSALQAGALATRARLLRRKRLLTAHQAALLDVMLWTARKPGSGMLTASLAVLARLAGQARSTAAEGVRRLEELGFLQRIRRRVRVAWVGGATASRQVANAYRLAAEVSSNLRETHTGSGARPARKQTSILTYVTEAAGQGRVAALEALEKVRAARLAAISRTKGALVCNS